MQLVDDRPTAVNYDAPAGGHGEAQVLAKLNDIEDAIQNDSYIGRHEDVLQAAIGLLDCVAAFNTAEMMWDYAKETDGDEDVFDDCIATVAAEFLFFTEHSYPLAYARMADGDRDGLTDAVVAMITNLGQTGRGDGEDDYHDDDDDDDEQPRKKRKKIVKPSAPKSKAKPATRRKR
jgi:hypothetical protein